MTIISLIEARQRDPFPATTWRVHLRKITQNDPVGEYRLALWCNSGGSMIFGEESVAEFQILDSEWQEFGFEWAAESSPGAADGQCTMWKASKYGSRTGHTNMTNTDAFNVDVQYLGEFEFAVHADTRGSVYHDNFES